RRKAVREAAPRQHLPEEMRASADDQVGARRLAAFDELRDLVREVLAVGIEGDDAVVAVVARVLESGLERRALAAVLRMDEHVRAGAARGVACAVARAVIDYDDVVHDFLRLGHDAADASLRVERRDQDDVAFAIAQTMPPPAETALMRTCRNSIVCSLFGA